MYILAGLCCLALLGGVGGGVAGGMGGSKTKTKGAKEAGAMLKPFQIKYSKVYYPKMITSFFFQKVDVEVCTGVKCNGYRGKQTKTQKGKLC